MERGSISSRGVRVLALALAVAATLMMLGTPASSWHQVNPCNNHIYGSGGGDRMEGTPSCDHLNGQGGNDTILGYGGADGLKGDSGGDQIHGAYGNDVIWGGSENDYIVCGADYDHANGGPGQYDRYEHCEQVTES